MPGYNPLAAAIQSMMSSGRMGGTGMSGGGFPSGGMSQATDSGFGGAPVNPSGGMGSLLASIRSAMGNPLQRGGQSGIGGGLGQGGMGGIDPNMLMMHLMGGGSLASLMQMMQARQGGGQPGVMGAAPQTNPAAGMMSAFNRNMAR
jgi:hypothetical protein